MHAGISMGDYLTELIDVFEAGFYDFTSCMVRIRLVLTVHKIEENSCNIIQYVSLLCDGQDKDGC